MTLSHDVERILARHARDCFHSFVEYVGRDDDGLPLDQRPLDHLVWDFVEACHAAGRPAGVMLPMGFGKTTQFCYRAAWELGRDPNRLVCLVTDSSDNAKERVGLVRTILATPEYGLVFPEVAVVPGHDERGRFTLKRTSLSKDPSCRAEGVLSGTGVRTNFLLMDDVVTQRNALLEPTSRRRVEESIRLTWTSRTKIRSRTPIRVAWIQTAYHQADAAAILREDPESGWDWLVVRAEEPYEELAWEIWQRGVLQKRGTVASPFPADDLAERARRMGPTAAARGLANRPVSDADCPFKKEHFTGPTPLRPQAYRQRVVFADPAGDATKLKSGDPDWCAVVGIGYHPTDHCWEVFLAERMRGTPSQQANFIARTAATARASVIWQEAVRDEALIEVTQRAVRALGRSIAVRPIKPTTNKEVRIIQTLEPALATSPPLLRVCGKEFPELKAEALAFPAAAHDDLLDALAGAFVKAPRICRQRRSLRQERWVNEIDRMFEGIQVAGDPFDDMLR